MASGTLEMQRSGAGRTLLAGLESFPSRGPSNLCFKLGRCCTPLPRYLLNPRMEVGRRDNEIARILHEGEKARPHAETAVVAQVPNNLHEPS